MFKTVAAAAAMMIAGPALAATNVAAGAAVTSTGYYNNGGEVFPASNITDGALNDTGTAFAWSFWLTPDGQNGTAVIDLGAFYSLDSIFVQNTLNRNYHDREAATVNYYVSSTAPVFGNTLSYGSLVGTSIFADTRGSGIIADDTLNFGAITGRYVTVDMTSFYGSSGGLNEVQVFGVAAAVPEPASWAMMLAGFGIVGFGLRTRRKPARVTYA